MTARTNTAVLRTAAALAGPDVDAVLYGGIGALPLFNPDHDREGAAVDGRVAAMRAEVRRADAILICTPEYAGALPAAMKNLLEWTIGDAGTYEKPVAWINAAGPAAPSGAADAHASLRKVLGYAGADIVRGRAARAFRSPARWSAPTVSSAPSRRAPRSPPPWPGWSITSARRRPPHLQSPTRPPWSSG